MYGLGFLLAGALPLLVAANPVLPRAGAPAYTPLAPSCSVYDILSGANYSNSDYNYTVANSNYYKPRDTLLNNTVYSFFSSEPQTGAPGASLLKACVEQCNSFSTCRSVMVGKNVPIPKGYYGADGTTRGTGCYAFSKPIRVSDLQLVTDGTWTEERTGTILCPPKQA